MPVDLFADYYKWTVSSGGTTAPTAGTSESWTVSSSTGAPAAATGVSQFRVVDLADVNTPPEIMIVTNVSGTTWTVTRGGEGGSPWAHLANWIAIPVLTAAGIANLPPTQVTAPAASSVPLTVNGATSQTADLLDLKVAGDSYPRFNVTPAGIGVGLGSAPPAQLSLGGASLMYGYHNLISTASIQVNSDAGTPGDGFYAIGYNTFDNLIEGAQYQSAGYNDQGNGRFNIDISGSFYWYGQITVPGSGIWGGNPDVFLSHSPTATHGTAGAGLTLQTYYAPVNVFTIQGASGQSGDLLEFKNSSGTVLLKVDSSANLVNYPGFIGIQDSNNAWLTQMGPSYIYFGPGGAGPVAADCWVQRRSAGLIQAGGSGASVQLGLIGWGGAAGIAGGGASGSAFMMATDGSDTRVNAPASGGYVRLLNLNSTELARFGTTGALLFTPIIPNTSAAVALTIQGAASQTGDLLEFQSSSSTVLTRIDGSGTIRTTQPIYLAGSAPSANYLQVGDGSTAGSHSALVLNPSVGNNAYLQFDQASVATWYIYQNHSDANLYIRDQTNARQQMTFTPGASPSASFTDIGTNLQIDGRTAIGGAGSWGGSTGSALFLTDDTADPSTNPTGGVIMFSAAGVLKVRDPSGSVTQLAPAAAGVNNLTQVFTTSGTVNAPSWAVYADVTVQGGGGSGGGGGTSATASLQAGGGGGAGSVPTRETVAVTGGTLYFVTVGGGAASVAGGAAGGNPGIRGGVGGLSSFGISAGSVTLVSCQGGSPGTFSAANSTTQGTGGYPNSNASTSGLGVMGQGASTGSVYWYLACGGATGGSACTATNGGGGGQAYQTTSQIGTSLGPPSAGASGTTSGLTGQSAGVTGCGGGGGGGGNNNTGAGGASGAGAAGKITITWRSA